MLDYLKLKAGSFVVKIRPDVGDDDARDTDAEEFGWLLERLVCAVKNELDGDFLDALCTPIVSLLEFGELGILPELDGAAQALHDAAEAYQRQWQAWRDRRNAESEPTDRPA